MPQDFTDFPPDQTGKSDTYTKNKKAREKKHRAQEKASGVTSVAKPGVTWDSVPEVQTLGPNDNIGTISGFRYFGETKIMEILKPTSKISIEALIDKELPRGLEKDLVVGDQVMYTEKDGSFFIIGRGKRENHLARFKGDANRPTLLGRQRQVIAANLDYAVIVAAAKNPSFHPNLVDRYLVLCQNGGVTPLICITKCDLTELKHPMLDWYEKELGATVIMTSVQTGKGIEELRAALNGKTCVLVGNSGVGKSTIANALLGTEAEETGSVGKKTGQGRHTTTASHVHQWAENSRIIDTPGIRSLEIFEIPKDELRSYFEEFKGPARACRYTDCSHTHEPECGVKAAVETGEVSKYRYGSYLRMHEDLV